MGTNLLHTHKKRNLPAARRRPLEGQDASRSEWCAPPVRGPDALRCVKRAHIMNERGLRMVGGTVRTGRTQRRAHHTPLAPRKCAQHRHA